MNSVSRRVASGGGVRILRPRFPVLSSQPVFGLVSEQSIKFKDNLELDLTIFQNSETALMV
jgi:hypothetical protein